MSSVFIAHSSRDKAFARQLAQDLRSQGVKVWLDESELLVGDSLVGKIQAAVSEMKYLAAILSSASVRSPWVQKELEAALALELAQQHVKVIPIRIDDCDIPSFLVGKLYVDFRDPENYETEFRRLLARLAPPRAAARGRKRTPENRAESLRLAGVVVGGGSPQGIDLDEAGIVLFSLLEGSSYYFSEYDCMEFAAFFATYAEVHRPSIGLLRSVAEFDRNSDWVVSGAIFGLAQMKSREGRATFRAVLASLNVDIYDKYRAIESVLQHSAVGLRDLPADWWHLIHSNIKPRQSYATFKRTDADSLLAGSVVRPDWVTIIRTEANIKQADYRSSTPDMTALKLKRIRQARRRLKRRSTRG